MFAVYVTNPSLLTKTIGHGLTEKGFCPKGTLKIIKNDSMFYQKNPPKNFSCFD